MVLKKNNLFIHILKNGHRDHFGVIEVKQLKDEEYIIINNLITSE